MAKGLAITDEHRAELYDSDTGKSLKTEKVVDITEDCPTASESHRAVLLFTRAKRGRIVQIVRPYPGEIFLGSRTHFFVDELARAPRDLAEAFDCQARLLALTHKKLLSIIRAHAPTNSRKAR